MAVSSFCLRTYCFTFFCCVLWMTLTNGDEGSEVFLLDEPTNTWKQWNRVYGAWGSLLPASNGYYVCTLGTPSDQWFVSSFISLPLSVRTVQVKIKYTVHSCDGLGANCRKTLNFLKKEQDTAGVPNLVSNPFTDVITSETPATAELVKGNFVDFGPRSTSSIAVNLQKKGVYFAFKTTLACVAVFSFKVSYKICSAKGINLVTFPRTISPPDSSPNISVNGTCVANAVHTSSQPSFLSALCNSNGDWAAGANVFCVCTAGYQRNVSLNMCEVCSKDSFKNEVGNGPCIKCPMYSFHETPTTRCLCNTGYYRGLGEDDNTDCTSIPSAPVDVKTTFINSSAVRLEWTESKDKGGRTDLFYEIKCYIKDESSIPCDSKVKYCPNSTGFKKTFVLASNLQALTSYEFQIVAKNGVSGIAGRENHMSISVMTKESIPGMPTGVKIIREKGSTTAHLQWSLEKKNGKVLFYEVRYYKVGSGFDQRVNSIFMNITITGLDPESDYRFVVRAYSSVGFGKFSKETESLGDKAISPEVRQLSKSAIVGISVSCGVVLVVSVLCFLAWVRCRRNDHDESKNDEGEATVMYHIPPSDPWELLEGQLTVTDTIGEGAFGEVCEGTLRVDDSKAKNLARSAVKRNTPQREITVAVKKLRDYAGDDEKQQFVEEIEMMKKLGQHNNIVNMIACRTRMEPFLLVVEYVPQGDLLKYLRRIRIQVSGSYCDMGEHSEKETTDHGGKSNKGYTVEPSGSQAFEGLDPEENKPVYINITHKKCIDNKVQVKVLPENGPSTDNQYTKANEDDLRLLELRDFLSASWQISCGMEYLATKGYVHRDLAARNVLIGQKKVVKVADFGLSRRMYEGLYQTKNARKLPIKWMPPESIFYQSFTTKSDVWAYGVLLWEMTTLGGIPYPGLNSKNLVKELRRGYRMEKPETCSDEIYSIMTWCWSERPEDRPSFTQIREQLETMMKKDSPYWDLSTLKAEGSTCYYTVPVIDTSSSSSDDIDSD